MIWAMKNTHNPNPEGGGLHDKCLCVLIRIECVDRSNISGAIRCQAGVREILDTASVHYRVSILVCPVKRL